MADHHDINPKRGYPRILTLPEPDPIEVLSELEEIPGTPTALLLDPIPVTSGPVLDPVPVILEPELVERPGLVRRAFGLAVRTVRGVSSALGWLFGAVVLMVGLAVLAALPLLQFLSLGYLLEAGGRVARSGRLRDGFIGVRLAARLGVIVAASWLLLLPVRYVAGLARAAQVIGPGGEAARAWRFWLVVLIAFTALHVAAACSRGGKLRYFLWPFNLVWLVRRLIRGGYYAEARDAVWDTVQSLRLPYYFSLGFKGFAAALVWLFLPVTLLALGRVAPPLGFLGAFLLAWVLLYLPFLQMRLAAENRLTAAFEWRASRAEYRRAPWAFAFAFVVTLLSALPLYLLKIEAVPSEAAWLPSLVFVVFIFPVRLLTGWALARARKHDSERHWFFRWTGRAPLLPAAAFYVLVVYFTQFTSWNGVFSLYEQHAFLVPVPFFGM